MYGPGPGETELSWPPVSLGPRANYHNLWEAIENVAHLILYKLYYTSNHQNIDFVVIAINLHVLPEMPSRNLLFRIYYLLFRIYYLLFRICTFVFYCSRYFFYAPSSSSSETNLIKYVESFIASYRLFNITRIRRPPRRSKAVSG